MTAGAVPSADKPFMIPSLDGIRCLAVMVVFIGHGLTIGGPWPGDAGVTVFFFLSGYLITTLLRREYERRGRISLGKFYVRRAIRILPPAYIAIAMSVVVGATSALPSTQNVWGTLSQLLNYTNYYMIWSFSQSGDAHAGLPPESSMLWSLAVEEHFYLIFPAILIILLRRKLTSRTIGFLLVGACALAPVWRLLLALNDADFYRLYVATDTRFDGLLAGAAMALLANPALKDAVPFGLSDRSIRFVLAPIAAVVAVFAAFLPGTVGLVIADTIIYICLVVLFWVVITWPDGLCGRVLNNRLVAHIGILSFSIYLLHRLVLGLAQLVTTVPLFVDIASLLVTVLLAQAMFMGVERPLGSVRKKLEARAPVPREPVSGQTQQRVR